MSHLAADRSPVSVRRAWMAGWVAAILLCLFRASAFAQEAPGFAVEDVQSAWQNNVLQVSARVHCVLSNQAVEALNKGVALTVNFEVEINRKRRYWLEENVASLTQRYQLRYHALTERYLLTNLNTGVQNTLPSLPAALEVMGVLVDFPVIDRQLLDAGGEYAGRLRARLDIDSLPAPLRLLAYFTPSWWLASDWYVWKVTM